MIKGSEKILTDLWERISNFFKDLNTDKDTMTLNKKDLLLINSNRIQLARYKNENKIIKAKTINEFAEKLMDQLTKNSYKATVENTTSILYIDLITLDTAIDIISDIADKMEEET